VDGRVEEVLGFWFGELDYRAIVAGERKAWWSSARGTLAYIIVLDQFSRNMFRGTAAMFAEDGLAREACRQGLRKRFDAGLALDERVFFYLPLMHSEDLSDQRRCVQLFDDMVKRVPEALKSDAEHYLDFAERHRDIVERFGRFPHRNEILGRGCSSNESEFLKEPGSSF
jgi:uncharacterized protein (DUF924 family)